MNCPYCHKLINENNNYCTKCGKKLSEQNDHFEQYKYNLAYSNIKISDEEYLKAYIGKNYDSLKNEKISIPALLFGPFYLLYRKMWLDALIVSLISIILINYTTTELFIILQILIEIYLGLKLNSIIIQRASSNVEKIKMSNPDKSDKDILKICQKSGNTSIISVIISILIILAFTYPYIAIYNRKETTPTKTVAQLDNMIYEVPTNNNISKYNNDSYHYYSYKDNNSFCSFNLLINSQTNFYKTTEEYLNKQTNNQNTERKKIKKDDTEWTILNTKNNNLRETYYITKRNNKFYILESRNYMNTNKCNTIENNLFNSISFNR